MAEIQFLQKGAAVFDVHEIKIQISSAGSLQNQKQTELFLWCIGLLVYFSVLDERLQTLICCAALCLVVPAAVDRCVVVCDPSVFTVFERQVQRH